MIEWADQLHHDNAPAHSTALMQVSLGKRHRFGSLRLLAFPKAKIDVQKEEICECDGQTVHKLSQRRLTADWLAPRESDCSRMHSTVSSDWLPSYIKAISHFPPRTWMSVTCECCVLSGRGLCDELITHPDESYRLWCVVVCDLETSWIGRSAKKNTYISF